MPLDAKILREWQLQGMQAACMTLDANAKVTLGNFNTELDGYEALTDDEVTAFLHMDEGNREATISQYLSCGEDGKAAGAIISCGGLNHDAYSLFGYKTSSMMLLQFYRSFTDDDVLYTCTEYVYTMDGYHFPRELIGRMKEIMDAGTVDWYFHTYGMPGGDDDGNLTVYRGAEQPETHPEASISWTTDRDTAIWFAYRRNPAQPTVYKGTIWDGDVLAYQKMRREHEVIQYNSVKDIECLTLTQAEANEAVQRHAEILKRKHYKEGE